MSTPNPVPAVPAPNPFAPSAPPVAGTPTASVVDKRWVSNQAIAITLRTNGDPRSDSVATFTVHHETVAGLHTQTTAADIEAWVVQEKARCEAEYGAMQMAHATLLAAIT